MSKQSTNTKKEENVVDQYRIYTYADLEVMLGISKRTLSHSVDRKELIPIIFGNKYRFLGSEVLRFLQQKMKQYEG